MYFDQGPTIIDQIIQLLQQIILPNWSDLILLVPWTLFGLILLSVLYLVVLWRRAAAVNRPRTIRPVPGMPPPGTHMPGPSRWPFVVPIGAAITLFAFVAPHDKSGLPFQPLVLVPGLIVTVLGIAGWLIESMREWRRTAATEQVLGETGVAVAPVLPPPLSPTSAVAVVPSGAVASTGAEHAIEPPPGVHLPTPSPWPFFAPIAFFVILMGFIFSAVLLVGGILLGVIAAAGWSLDAGREYHTTEEFGHPVYRTRDPERVWPRRLVALYAAVIAVSVMITLAPVGFSYLNGLTPGSASPSAQAVPQVPEISTHSAVSFDTKTLVVPCCRPFDLVFHNENASVPHNVQISTDPSRSNILFDGEVVTGVADATYHVGALQAGTYYFACKIHPNMNGTVQALEGGGPQGAPPPQGSQSPQSTPSVAP